MKLILSTINGAGANKIFVAPAPAPPKLAGSMAPHSGSSKIGWLHGSALQLRLPSPADIAEILNISNSVTMHRVAKCLENSKSLQDHPRSGRPQVINCETVKNAFENDPTLKMTTFA